MDKENIEHKETVITEGEEGDLSSTPLIDLVKNQKPHEFGGVITSKLGDMARSEITDLKSDNYSSDDLGEFE